MTIASDFHNKIPKNRVDNLHWRKWLLGRCRQNKRVREGLAEACKYNVLFYVNAFVWTYDPRTKWKSLPFVSYPYQDTALVSIQECVHEGVDLVIEKSRDMGASWISLVAMEHLWHFWPGFSFLAVSRKEGLVDSPGDPDSLFWKLDFLHHHLPEWLLPKGLDRRKLHFGNLDNGSTMDGESTTGAAGVGGRRSAMFIDEFSRIEEGKALLSGTADTTTCRIFNFTPFGASNAAYELASREDIRKLRMHWSDHPEKAAGLYRYDEMSHKVEVLDKQYSFPPDFNFIMDGKLRSVWYDMECRRRANPKDVAMNLDIDYQGSAYKFFDRIVIVDLIRNYAQPPMWEGDISHDPDSGRPLGLIEQKGGPLKLWIQMNKNGLPPTGNYVAGADISTGSGATNSCFSLADSQTGEKILEYASANMRPEQFARGCVALCWMFKTDKGDGAKFAWEQQGPGRLFGQVVIELGYRNVFFREATHATIGHTISQTPGWYPNTDSKLALMEEYRTALGTRKFLNRSEEALKECLMFIVDKAGKVVHEKENDGEDPTGARQNHGDRVVADALCWKMAKSLGAGKENKRADEEVIKPGSLAWRRQLGQKQKALDAAWI